MWEKELLAAIEAGKRASVKIMEIYKKGFDVEIKSDNSPVTEADKLADKMIPLQSSFTASSKKEDSKAPTEEGGRPPVEEEEKAVS